MNKSIIAAIAVAATLAAPTFAFAQSTNGPVTRAEVKAQLVQLERAGYTPGGDQTNYPNGIQKAEARVQGQQVSYNQSSGASIYGSSASGSGAPAHNASNSVIGNGYNHP